MDNFWCVTVIFNPAGYQSRIDNYLAFRARLESQNVNLLTVELTFKDQKHQIKDAIHLHGNSIMWQKERLINHAISNLPNNCTHFAWLDSDLLFPDNWIDLLKEKFQTANFVQLFERVVHLKQNEKNYGGQHQDIRQGIVWQSKTYKEDWIPLRLQKKIFHAEPGFAWAAERQSLPALYDKLIVGSGDNFLVDCLLGSEALHHYWTKLTSMLRDMAVWKKNFKKGTTDYLPIDICHLWHGNIKNRAYNTRDLILNKHGFDPTKDIKIENNVWEWSSDKPNLHQDIIDYFHSRREDGDK